ncbi:MAG: glycosyltransferase family 2 protein [Deltaproteobacteria bacterium]|nr:glycosyltransferase family 2 protein [Deltaproteobacteria bacterium]
MSFIPDSDSKTLVVIPLFNEEETIVPVIEETRRHYSGDILIVNDGSTDSSLERIALAADDRIFVLNHGENKGYGRSLIDGFEYAETNRYDFVITMDCDFQHEPCCIPHFLGELREVDVVSGSRYFFDVAGSSDAPADRYRINKVITSEINKLTCYTLTDAFCGFKGYRTASLGALKLTESGYAMPLQFWIQAGAAGLKVKEIPVKRIYLNLDRRFGNGLDDPEHRLAYYRSVIDREYQNVRRCFAHRCASR